MDKQVPALRNNVLQCSRTKARWAFLPFVLLALSLLAPAGAQAQTYSLASCGSGTNTTITGTVYDPAGKNPLPNILVYVPQAALTAFTDGVNTTTPVKDSYANLVSGNQLVQVTTGADGTFSLVGVPAGTLVPLVIQAGRWRRQFVISAVTACAVTSLYSTAVTTVGTDPSDLNTSNLTQGGSSSLSHYGEHTTLRFARNQNEGDIPKIALVTGGSDGLECSLRKIGIDDAEFTDTTVGINSNSGSSAVSISSPTGRVNLYQRNLGGGASAPSYTGSTTAISFAQTGYDLFGTTSKLDGYNVLLLPCPGEDDTTLETSGSNITYAENVAGFTNAGGRIFATHFSSDLLNSVSSISGAANWVTSGGLTPDTAEATVNSTSSDSKTMGQWLYDLNAGTEYQVAVSALRISQTGTNSPTVDWATITGGNWRYSSTTIANPVVEFSYYTPVTASSTSDQYGRVFFTDYHVNDGGSDGVYPSECDSTMDKTYAMTAEEEMLEYSLFQLMNFAIPQFQPSASLTVAATPTTLGAGDTGDNLDFTITNGSSTQDITLDAPVTLILTLPTGITATGASGTGWSCTTSSSTVTCTLSSALAANTSNTVNVTVNLASNVSTGTSVVTALLESKEFTANLNLSATVSTTSVISPQSTTTTLSTSAASVMYGTPVTFTAQLRSASGTPTGTVTFYAGTTSLGTGQLTGGMATLSTASLAAGTYSITAVYGGSRNYATSTSAVLTQQVIDLDLTLSGSGSSTTTATVTTTAGGSASVMLVLTSNQSTVLPVDSTLVITGQPSGTGVSLTGENWQALATASWLFPKGYTLTSPTLTFALPSQLASNHDTKPVFHSGAAPLLLSLLLLPFARRMRKVGKRLVLLLVLALSLAGTLGMTACTAHNGFYAQKSYTVTVTLTAGRVTKVSYVTLSVN